VTGMRWSVPLALNGELAFAKRIAVDLPHTAAGFADRAALELLEAERAARVARASYR